MRVTQTSNVVNVLLAFYRNDFPSVIGGAIQPSVPSQEVSFTDSTIGTEGLDLEATVDGAAIESGGNQLEFVGGVADSIVGTPSLSTYQECLLTYVVDVVHAILYGLGTCEVLCAALHVVALASQTQVVQQSIDLVSVGCLVKFGLYAVQGLSQIAVLLILRNNLDVPKQHLHVTSAALDVGNLSCQLLGQFLKFSSVLVVLQLILSIGQNLTHFLLHGLGQGQILPTGSQIHSGANLSCTVVVVNFLYVDTAVIEVATPVLLDVGCNHVGTYAQDRSGDVNLNGILSASPTHVLLQQVTVHVCPVGIVVANIQRVRQSGIDLVDGPGTTNPVVGVAAVIAVTLVGGVVLVAIPNGLDFRHVANVTCRHCLLVPHGVIKFWHCPGKSFLAAIHLGICNLISGAFLILGCYEEVVVVSTSNPDFLTLGLVNQRHATDADVAVCCTTGKVKDNLQVLHMDAWELCLEVVLAGCLDEGVLQHSLHLVVLVFRELD